MQENELMCYYVIMNDFKSTLMPRNLQGIVDEKLKIDVNWEVEGSDFSFPLESKIMHAQNIFFCYAIKMLGL